LLKNNSSEETIDEFINATGAYIIHSPRNEPCFISAFDTIKMPPIESFVNSENYYSTLFHELTHWTGAEKRLSRIFEGWGKESYAFEELVAELGSLFLCMSFNIDTESTQHSEYLKSWIKHLKNDRKSLYKAASMAQQAVEYLLSLTSNSGMEIKVA
jgi:antirestriction protein ArdC